MSGDELEKARKVLVAHGVPGCWTVSEDRIEQFDDPNPRIYWTIAKDGVGLTFTRADAESLCKALRNALYRDGPIDMPAGAD